jgi:hypothetical protein
MLNPDKAPSKADKHRYQSLLQQVREDIESIDLALRRVTKNLKIIHERRLYRCGGYETFAEFAMKELGKSRIHAYRLLQAHETMQSLLESGIAESDLPPTERLCREVRRIEDPDEQARIWKAVTRIAKERGRKPSTKDVQEEAAAKGHPSAIDRQQMELVQKFEGMERALHVSFRFDVLDPPFRKRLLVALEKIAASVQLLISALQSSAVSERVGKI